MVLAHKQRIRERARAPANRNPLIIKFNGNFLVEIQVPSQRTKPSHPNCNRGVININQVRLLFCISAHRHTVIALKAHKVCDERRNTPTTKNDTKQNRNARRVFLFIDAFGIIKALKWHAIKRNHILMHIKINYRGLEWARVRDASSLFSIEIE